METNTEGKEMRKHLDKMKPIIKYEVMISYDISETDRSLYREIFKIFEKKHEATSITESNYKFNEQFSLEGIGRLKTELGETLKTEIPLNENFRRKHTKVVLVYAADNYSLIEDTIIDETLTE